MILINSLNLNMFNKNKNILYTLSLYFTSSISIGMATHIQTTKLKGSRLLNSTGGK